MQKKWMEITGVSRLTCNSCVCSDHFKTNAFHDTGGYSTVRRLLPNAAPTKALRKINSYECSTTESNISSNVSLELLNCDTTQVASINKFKENSAASNLQNMDFVKPNTSSPFTSTSFLSFESNQNVCVDNLKKFTLGDNLKNIDNVQSQKSVLNSVINSNLGSFNSKLDLDKFVNSSADSSLNDVQKVGSDQLGFNDSNKFNFSPENTVVNSDIVPKKILTPDGFNKCSTVEVNNRIMEPKVISDSNNGAAYNLEDLLALNAQVSITNTDLKR